jgi:hypothetical protein
MSHRTLADAVGIKLKPGRKDEFEVIAVALLEARQPRAALLVAERHGFMDGVPKTFAQCRSLEHTTPTKVAIYKNAIRALRIPSIFRHLKKYCEVAPVFPYSSTPKGYGILEYRDKHGIQRASKTASDKIKVEKMIVRAWGRCVREGGGITFLNCTFKTSINRSELDALVEKYPWDFEIGSQYL